MPSSVARGGGRGGGLSPSIGLLSTQNRTFLLLFRPIFGEKLKTAPPKEIGCRSREVDVVIRCEKVFEYAMLAEKSDSISAFFFWRPPVFERKKRLNFRAFQEIPSQFSDKPCETDSRTTRIRVKVVCTSLTISKKRPLFQILATRLFVPPQTFFCPPPSHATLAPGLVTFKYF